MNLTRDAVMEYQQLYKTTYGREISYQDAMVQGEKLVQLIRLVLKPYQLVPQKGGKNGNQLNSKRNNTITGSA